ncbi:MAG: inositol monophosphatase [Actinomycetota bacterium]|nr:inositol monophosphatase [Actinomycetota bacterium]
MKPDRLALLHEVADVVAAAFAEVRDFGPSGGRDGQYALDLVADEAALAVLRRAGVGILSEESGFEPGSTGEVVVIDPIDGSTNASRGVPYFATSLCLLDGDGPAVALVANQAGGERYWAVRGGGAWRDGVAIRPSSCTSVGSAIVGLNGLPPRPLGYAQCRVLGAVALDLCLVASGVLDGYIDCVADAHGGWDFMGGLLICQEAGAAIADLHGRDLVVRAHADRRTPVAAATPELLEALLAERR